MKKHVEIVLKLAINGQSDKAFLLASTFVPKGLSAPAQGLYTCIKALKYIPGPGVRWAFTGPLVLWFVHYELKYYGFSLKSFLPKVWHALHWNYPWFLKYLQKFALDPDFPPLLSDNEYFISPNYFGETDVGLLFLSTEKQSISASFLFIQCQLGVVGVFLPQTEKWTFWKPFIIRQRENF